MSYLCFFVFVCVKWCTNLFFFVLYVFTFLVPCCDVRHDFSIKTMSGSSLPPIVCMRARVLFMLFVFVGV